MYTFATSRLAHAGTVRLQVYRDGRLVAETTCFERDAEAVAARLAGEHAASGRVGAALS